MGQALPRLWAPHFCPWKGSAAQSGLTVSWPDFSGADQLRSRCLPAWGAQLEAVKQQSLRALGSFLSPPAAGGPALGEGTTKARPGLGLLRCPPVKREIPTAVAWGGGTQ